MRAVNLSARIPRSFVHSGGRLDGYPLMKRMSSLHPRDVYTSEAGIQVPQLTQHSPLMIPML